MKTIFASAFYVLFITVSLSFSTITKTQEKENKIVATFKGVTDDDFYKFIDDKKGEFLFYDMHDDIEVDLHDEENIDKKFTVVWVEKKIDTYDEEGEPTGKKITVKSIISLTLAK